MDSIEQIINLIEKLTVLELNELVKALEEKFGVSAAAPVVMAASGGGDAGGGGSEKSSFTVFLESIGESKMAVIKAIKEILGIGLKEAKELVDSAPQELKKDVAKEDAEKIKEKLEEAGATVELK